MRLRVCAEHEHPPKVIWFGSSDCSFTPGITGVWFSSCSFVCFVGRSAGSLVFGTCRSVHYVYHRVIGAFGTSLPHVIRHISHSIYCPHISRNTYTTKHHIVIISWSVASSVLFCKMREAPIPPPHNDLYVVQSSTLRETCALVKTRVDQKQTFFRKH